MHFYLDTVSRNHNKEEQVEGVDRFQAVSRRTAKIVITELSTLLAISCSLQPDLTMNLLPLEICHITGTTTGFRFYQTKVWFMEVTNKYQSGTNLVFEEHDFLQEYLREPVKKKCGKFHIGSGPPPL